jgi:hypothetical protein
MCDFSFGAKLPHVTGVPLLQHTLHMIILAEGRYVFFMAKVYISTELVSVKKKIGILCS